jgi:hypothetical protein
MFNTDSHWFEIAVVSFATAIGNIYMGHFEEKTPKWRRALKLVTFIIIVCVLSYFAGRVWAFGFLGVMLLEVLYIHIIWLPKKGINGWTGEPKEKYYELRKWKKK